MRESEHTLSTARMRIVSGNPRVRLQQLESQLQDTQYECRQINPHGFENAACERVAGLRRREKKGEA